MRQYRSLCVILAGFYLIFIILEQMKIKQIKVKNFRTLENIEIKFSGYYTAICGKNNSGKSNLIRAIRSIFANSDFPLILGDENLRIFKDLNISRDVTFWKADSQEDILLSADFDIHSQNDAGIYKFLEQLILQKQEDDTIEEFVCLSVNLLFKTTDKKINEVEIIYRGNKIDDTFKKEEILRKIRSSNCTIYHNSTSSNRISFPGGGIDSIYDFLSEEDKAEISKQRDDMIKQMKDRLKKQQIEFASFLGRLEEKYEVGLSISERNSFERSSINISLKEKGVDVNLDDWGSGTQNRTLIFLKLLNAKKIKETIVNSDKITPFVIIEEPESFLHPSAQAEFGRVLQDIAEELQIQVIVTTHSVYLLNHKQAESNILLDRIVDEGKIKGTDIIDTKGEKWYEPFALILGINGEDFGPLKNTIFSEKDEIILVEGESDKKYLELLKDQKHGENALKFKGEILAYDGFSNIDNAVLLRFIKGRFSRFLITVDLDVLNQVKKTFNSVGLVENNTYIAIGLNEEGKKSIEGLVPASIWKKVLSDNYELVMQTGMSSNVDKDVQKSAKSKLKQIMFREFFDNQELTQEYFGEFYKLANSINKIFDK